MAEFINKILCGDTVEVMKELPDEVFDFCFADPPYFRQIDAGKKLFRVNGDEFDGCDDDWDKFSSMDSYKQFTINWLTQVRRLLKKDGAICVISGRQSIYEIGSILRSLGFWVINDIIWKKTNPTPNFKGTRLNNSHETLIWAAKSKKSRFTFNYKTGKYLNGGKQMGSVWELPICSGNERLKDGQNKKLHSTQKPEALLYRVIALFTKPGDLVLDPFGGTRTTGAVAKRRGRQFTRIEREPKYVEYGQKRLDAVTTEMDAVAQAAYDIQPLKVSMKEMVAAGYFKIGETFFNEKGEKAVLADNTGKLTYKGVTQSMHEVAALRMGQKRRVNAFQFLYVMRDGAPVSIDIVRLNYREALEKSAGFT